LFTQECISRVSRQIGPEKFNPVHVLYSINRAGLRRKLSRYHSNCPKR
jgi:hypothetical protein